MRYSMIAAPIALAATVIAGGNETAPVEYTTQIVTSFTTYCPGPTTLTHGGSTYTVTEATTLTITDCPCTLSHPIYSAAPATSAAPAPPVVATGSPVPVVSAPVVAPVAPVVSAPVVAPVAPVAVQSVPAAKAASVAPVAPFPTVAAGSPVVAVPVGTASSAPSSPVSPIKPVTSPFTGAGNKVAASDFSLAALLGLAAYLL